MTARDLSRLFRLRAEREKLHARWMELRAESGGIHSPRLDGIPKDPRGRDSSVERYAVQIADAESAMREKDAEIIRAEIAIYRFIDTVLDSKTRLILTLRFVDCLTWDEVAQSISDGCTVWQVKQHCYRYLENAASKTNDAP